jgi:hypothetical protein
MSGDKMSEAGSSCLGTGDGGMTGPVGVGEEVEWWAERMERVLWLRERSSA